MRDECQHTSPTPFRASSKTHHDIEADGGRYGSADKADANAVRTPHKQPVEEDVDRARHNEAEGGHDHQALALQPPPGDLEASIAGNAKDEDLEVLTCQPGDFGVLSEGE